MNFQGRGVCGYVMGGRGGGGGRSGAGRSLES